MTVFTLSQATAIALDGLSRRDRFPARSGAPHRTGAPVLRNSIEAGTFEDLFFMVPAKGETDRLLAIARRTLDAGRRLRRDARSGQRTLSKAERTITLLTAAAVRVYEEILTLARLNRGRVFPSYDYLSEATGLGRATIARALHILEEIGFLVRQRRFKRIESSGPGPRYRQTSNAYRPTLPQRVLAYLPRWMRPAPVPDDVVQHGIDRLASETIMLEAVSCRELAKMTVGGQLGKMLEKLGALIDRAPTHHQCESHNHPEPLTKLYK